MLQTANAAFADIAAAWRTRRTAMAFAAEDIQDVYRRTSVGPLWMLLSYLIFVLSIVLIAGQKTPNYLPFVAMGLLVFNIVSEVLGESTTLFRREQSYIKGTTMPIFGYIVRATFRMMLREAFPLLGAIALILYSGLYPSGAWFFSILGLLLIVVTAPAAYTVLGIIGVYVPDLAFIMANVLRLMFFLSPILWDHAGDPIRQLVFLWNPLTHFIDIVRSPILSGDLALHSWTIAIGISLALWIVAILLLGRYRDRIVFML